MKEIEFSSRHIIFITTVFLLLATVLFSGCIGADNDNPEKIPAEISDVWILDSNDSRANRPILPDDQIYLFGHFSFKYVPDGYDYDYHDVDVWQDGNVIHVTVNLRKESDGMIPSGFRLNLGKRTEFADGVEYKIVINNGTDPIKPVTFRYDGDFLITYSPASVDKILIQQNGTQIEAVAEITNGYINPQMIDEENMTFRQSADFKETVVYIPIHEVNSESLHTIQVFTKQFVIGDLTYLSDGIYNIQINHKEVTFEICDGILYYTFEEVGPVLNLEPYPVY